MMEVTKCIDCGSIEEIFFNIDIQDMIDQKNTQIKKKVYLLWSAMPSYKQITYAKKFFPELTKSLNADLLKRYEHEKEWFMGYFDPDDVKGLGLKAKAKGLEVKITDAD